MPTALIVEDEPEAHKLLATLVRIKGYRTVSAFSGAEALNLIAAEAPDVILLDLMLPEVSGWDVCRKVKEARETAAIPVVIISAALAVENRLRSFALGADAFVAKPYTPDVIFQALDEAAQLSARGEPDLAEGAFDVFVGDDGESLRDLGRVLNLLRARTEIDPDRLAGVGQALRAWFEEANAWGTTHGVARIATFWHRSFGDRVEFQWIDQSGRSVPDDAAARGAAFDEVQVDRDARSVLWIARIRPGC